LDFFSDLVFDEFVFYDSILTGSQIAANALSVPVPEPSLGVLLAVGGLALGLRRRR